MGTMAPAPLKNDVLLPVIKLGASIMAVHTSIKPKDARRAASPPFLNANHNDAAMPR